MKLSIVSLASVLVLSGCGAVHVQSPLGSTSSPSSAKPASSSPSAAGSPSPSPAVTSPSTPTSASSSTTTTSSAAEPPSEVQRDVDRNMGDLDRHLDEITRTGKVTVSQALDGFSPDERLAFFKQLYKAPQTPTDATLQRVTDTIAKQKAAAVSAAKKENLSKPGAADPGAERAIRKDFDRRYPGIKIVSVKMIDSAWKVNLNDYGAPRNRYKDAEVLLAIKGTKACVAVPANAAQKAIGGGKFATEYEHDEFIEGLAVPCP